MGHSAVVWFITLGTCLIFTSADSSKGCTHYAGIGQRYELPLRLAKDTRLRWLFNNGRIYDSKAKNNYSVTAGGALILPKVALRDEGSYTAEVYNKEGQIKKDTLVLCVQESVSKPTVAFECQAKSSRVQFTCSVPQTKDISYEWLDGGKVITTEKGKILHRTSKQLGSNSFTCKVSNMATSQTSDPVQSSPDCIKYVPPATTTTTGSTTPDDDGKLLGLDFWLMIGILAGGGGLVLMLIVATIVCCSINRRKRRMRVKDEQELRLQWNTSHQHHHYGNQRGHAHSHGPGHSHGPAHATDPSPRQATAKQGPAAAGHTGPRPPKARQNRPRPPDPITGQPLPGPRRQPEMGETQVPSIGNDEENPPPLPQPRKKGPRTQRR